MSFATLRSRHLTNNVLDTDRFAETVTIKDTVGTEYEVPAVVRRQHSNRESDQGHYESVEEVVIVISPTAIPQRPQLMWTLHLSGEGNAFQYSYEGKTTAVAWTLHFERVLHVV